MNNSIMMIISGLSSFFELVKLERERDTLSFLVRIPGNQKEYSGQITQDGSGDVLFKVFSCYGTGFGFVLPSFLDDSNFVCHSILNAFFEMTLFESIAAKELSNDEFNTLLQLSKEFQYPVEIKIYSQDEEDNPDIKSLSRRIFELFDRLYTYNEMFPKRATIQLRVRNGESGFRMIMETYDEVDNLWLTLCRPVISTSIQNNEWCRVFNFMLEHLVSEFFCFSIQKIDKGLLITAPRR